MARPFKRDNPRDILETGRQAAMAGDRMTLQHCICELDHLSTSLAASYSRELKALGRVAFWNGVDNPGTQEAYVTEACRVLYRFELGDAVGFCKRCGRGRMITVDKARSSEGVWLAACCEACGAEACFGNLDSRPDHRNRDRGASEGNPTPPSPESWHRILQVPLTATWEEVRAAHRERSKEYHPDRLQTHGAELRALAERKMKEINAAYEQARAAIGR